ncbi:helix-turn-helix transcriptional regulator [Cereibacter sphaeroides f. sp. denitrificans]|nr:XRE family transcriptional regulator [Cereibacter sphaeroides f. sp. denitrificans]
MTADELREARAKLGLTQPEMAERIGYSLDGYKKLEGGARKIRPTVEKLIKQMES